MKIIIQFYSKEQIKNGSFQTLLEELIDEGFNRQESISSILKYIN